MKVERHGLLLVDKPADITSHDVVARARKILNQRRIGHTGTLDPIATGLMVLVLGEATKLSDYLTAEDKTYRVRIRLGVRTDTLDRTGQVIETRPVEVNEARIREEALKLQGRFEWPVPKFSAVKVGGQALYKMARQQTDQAEMTTPVKEMRFWDLKILEVGPDTLDLEITCSKGSYVRTWADQLGQRLGCGAMVEELRRTRVGGFSVADSAALSEDMNLDRAFIKMADALPSYRALIADDREAALMANGQVPKEMMGRLIPEQKQAFESNDPVYVKVVSKRGDLLALLAAEPGQGLKIRRVFRV